MGIYATRLTHDHYKPPTGGEAWIEDEHTPGLIRRRQSVQAERARAARASRLEIERDGQ